MKTHSKKVEQLQNAIKSFRDKKEGSSPIALRYQDGHSNTTRTKAYKRDCPVLDFGQLNEIILIDCENKVAIVEPRVTMEALLQATLPYHLTPPILPEFKGITVGGAIMGGAGESASHQWGCFNDICRSYEIICGNGDLLKLSPQENSDLYYGIAGSYGSLGALVSAEIQLIPVQDHIYLHHHFFSDPLEAIEMIRSLFHSSSSPDFLDGIIFAKDLAVVMEGNLQPKGNESHNPPLFSLESSFSPWFYQHMKELAIELQTKSYKEKMTLEDYFFRYDLGGFWMGAFLFQVPFLARFISQGILGYRNREKFTKTEIQRFHCISEPYILGRTILRPFLKAQNLWALLHKAESWIQKRMIIQDFCIPESKTPNFCQEILDNPAIFPIWICPIKGTRMPQIFAPHLLSHHQKDSHFINFGLYGIPSHADPIQHLTKTLEQNVSAYGGRKALYSRSYYTQEEFWQIYSRSSYEDLRHKTQAHGMWHEITDKVLSE